MKTQNTILALMMFFSIISANAQITWNAGVFSCTVNDTNVVCQPNNTCTLTCTITNTSCGCTTIQINQIIDSSFTLPVGWYVTMSNPNGNFPSTTTQNTFALPLASGSSVTATFEIHSGNNTGNADVRVNFLNVANSSNNITFHIIGSTSTGIASVENTNLFLSQNYPNPFVNTTTVKYNLEQPNGKIVITDISGKTIREYSLNSNSGEIILNEKLQSGIYFYSLYSNNKIITTNKMLIQ